MENHPHVLRTVQRTVLSIEANLSNIHLIEALISLRSDLKLITARNGTQGLQLASLHLPDVILLDSHLPDIGGMEVLKTLLGTVQTAHIPVIAVSSDASPQQIRQGIQAGFFAYLTKPYNITELMDYIDKALLSAG